MASGNPTRQIILELVQVVSFIDITPHMRRITVMGKELRGLQGITPGIHLKLLIPQPGQEKPIMPIFDANGQPLPPPEQGLPSVRTYTVRSFSPETGELAIDFVLHGDEGPASAWATTVQIGNYLGVALRGGIPYRQADWYLLAGDQTALPAISAILEQLPASANGLAFVEIPDATEEQALHYNANITLHWLHRNGTEAGKSTILEEAIRAAPLPDGRSEVRFIWVATESSATKRIRDYLRMQYQLGHHELHAAAYWKLGLNEDAYHVMRHREAEQ